VLRACGFADAMLRINEPRVLARAARLPDRPAPPTLEQFTAIADAWRPFRTLATVLLRLAGDRDSSSAVEPAA